MDCRLHKLEAQIVCPRGTGGVTGRLAVKIGGESCLLDQMIALVPYLYARGGEISDVMQLLTHHIILVPGKWGQTIM